MDEFNNNPFNEDKNAGESSPNPYNAQNDPYNQQHVQGQNGQPYQQQYNVPPQNGQYQQGQNPYNMPQGGYGYNQQNIPQNGYAAPQGYGVPYQPQQTGTGMAVASLVLGIISICAGIFMFEFPVLFLVPIIGIILGIVFKCKRLHVGKGMSTAGIITSVIGLILPILFIVVMLANMTNLLQYIKDMSPEQYEQLYEMYGEQFPEWFAGVVSLFAK